MQLKFRLLNSIGLVGLVLLIGLAGLACRAGGEPTPAAQSAAPTPPAPTPTAGSAAIAVATPKVGVATPWATKPQDAKYGGTFRIAGGSIPHYDIQQYATANAATVALGPKYDNLVRVDERNARAIVPDLAEDWDISPDGKSYIFHIRKGVTFHDGSPLTAEDVVATFQRHQNPPKGILTTRSQYFEGVTIEATDQYTVRFTRSKVLVPFLNALGSGFFAINSKKVLERNNFDLRRVIDAPGTGPFIFQRFVEGEHWEYEKNPNYWNKGMPFVDRLEIWSLSGVAAAAALKTGKLDHKRVVSKAEWDLLKDDPRVKSAPINAISGVFVYFDLTKAPWNDVRVRRALHLVIDRDVVLAAALQTAVRAAQGDLYIPATTSWEKELLGDSWKQIPGLRSPKDEDIKEAQRLMRAAGWEQGLGERVALHRGELTPTGTWPTELLSAMATRYLGKTSFKLVASESAIYYEKLLQGDFSISVGSTNIGGELDDPVSWLGVYSSTHGQNYTRFSDREYDALIDQIGVTLDYQKRMQRVMQARELLYSELPVFPMYWLLHVYVWMDYVKGHLIQNTVGLTNAQIRWDTVWLDKAR